MTKPINQTHYGALVMLQNHARVYLEWLQGGKFGPPTLEHLENAGALHAWLENLGQIEKPLDQSPT